MEINQAWIDQQRAVCEAATPGPWEWDTCLLVSMNPLVAGCVLKPYYYNDDDEVTISITPGDAKLIAVASTALPAALEALESSMQRESEKDAEIARLTAERDAAVEQRGLWQKTARRLANHEENLQAELSAERKKFAKLYGNHQSGMSTKMIPCPICAGTANIRLSQRHDAPELFNLMCGECYGHATIQLFTDAPTGAESEKANEHRT